MVSLFLCVTIYDELGVYKGANLWYNTHIN